MKKFNILLSVMFFAGSWFSCKASFKTLSGALICSGRLPGVQSNPFIRLCKHQDVSQVHKILCQHNMEKVVSPQSEKLTLVYEQKQIIAGVCIAGFDGFVWRLAVDQQYQKQGIGKELLQETLFRLQSEHKAQSLALRSTKLAIPFYQKLGFNFHGHLYEYALGSLVLEQKDI